MAINPVQRPMGDLPPAFLSRPFSSWRLERPGDSRSLPQKYGRSWQRPLATSKLDAGRACSSTIILQYQGFVSLGFGVESRWAVVSQVTSKRSDPVTSPLGDTGGGGRRRRRFSETRISEKRSERLGASLKDAVCSSEKWRPGEARESPRHRERPRGEG